MSSDGTGAAPARITSPPGPRDQGPAGQQDPRRRRLARMLAVGTAVTAALAASITAALHVMPAAPSPLSGLTSALARTSAQSYTFRLRTTVRFSEKVLNSDLVSGAYDPGQRRGTELLAASSRGKTEHARVRFIGAYLFTSVSPGSGFGKPWDASPLGAAEAAGMPPGDRYGFVSDQPVTPAELTVVLRAAGTAVRDAGGTSGAGWTGIKYTFTASLYDGRESVSGSVCVDLRGRTRLMTITTREGGQATGRPLITDRDIAFGDFGAPVRVTTPPASQVTYTSGKPYWGFYF